MSEADPTPYQRFLAGVQQAYEQSSKRNPPMAKFIMDKVLPVTFEAGFRAALELYVQCPLPLSEHNIGKEGTVEHLLQRGGYK